MVPEPPGKGKPSLDGAAAAAPDLSRDLKQVVRAATARGAILPNAKESQAVLREVRSRPKPP